ncbi:glycosyl hydrolase family 18 protein [Paenibacillus tarimensis]
MIIRWTMAIVTALLLFIHSGLYGSPATAAEADGRMTKFRVYQNEKALKEFATDVQAVAYAKGFAYSHVEKIADREWIWDNFPRYIVYQNGVSRSNWEFRTYNEALKLVKTLQNVHIRDVQQPGWVYGSHAKYQLYQGDKTKEAWAFASLEAAKNEAKKWANAHIIELATNKWIWDNLTGKQMDQQRQGKAVYAVIADGVTAGETYSFLYDAIQAAAEFGNSVVKNNATGRIVHSNIAPFRILQSGREIRSFFGIDQAVRYAKGYANTQVVRDGNVWWTNVPYLQAKQGDKTLGYVHTRGAAVALASKYANSAVVTGDGRMIWNNAKKLIYMGWNGSSSTSAIVSQLSLTQGLDIDSPTWYELASADGTLKDTSDPALSEWLHNQGIQLMPLVHNQFDAKLSTAFLSDAEAQKTFIEALISSLVKNRAHGINIDFESLAGSDRDRFTAFVSDLAAAARKHGLTVSIDLPRGSLAWNHQTAFDHEKLATIVDFIMIMAYDQYWKGSTTHGSVAGLTWTEAGVQEFLTYGIPRSKLLLGIPFYTREWQLDAAGKLVGNRTLLMKDIPALLDSRKVTSEFDPAFGQMKMTYEMDGYTYIFWAETADTVKARIDIAKKYDLAGVAIWRLGYEQADLWTMMLQNK